MGKHWTKWMGGLNHLPYFIANIVIFSKYSNISSILLKWGKYGFSSIIIPHNRPESLRLSAAVQNNLQPDLRHQTPDWAVLGWCPSPLVWWCRALTRRSANWWVSTPSTQHPALLTNSFCTPRNNLQHCNYWDHLHLLPPPGHHLATYPWSIVWSVALLHGIQLTAVLAYRVFIKEGFPVNIMIRYDIIVSCEVSPGAPWLMLVSDHNYPSLYNTQYYSVTSFRVTPALVICTPNNV